MNETIKKNLIVSLVLLGVFVIYTFSVMNIDVSPIGPENSSVGFSSLNGPISAALSFNKVWYVISKILGIIAIMTAVFFMFFTVLQIITRKGIFKADRDLYILMIFYGVIFCTYILFEVLIINYRPVILDEGLEASYPSTHTLLAVCIFSVSAMQLKKRIAEKNLNRILVIACIAMMVLTIISRFLSGVHWFTDIIGGVIISAFIVSLYMLGINMISCLENENRNKNSKTKNK